MLDKLSKLKKFLPNDQGVFLGFLLSLFSLFAFYPLGNETLSAWDRTIGPATLAGIDIQKRTGGFSSCHIVLLPLLAFAFSIFCSKIPFRLKIRKFNVPLAEFTFYLSTISSALFLAAPLPALGFSANQALPHALFFAVVFFGTIFATRKSGFYKSVASDAFKDVTVVFPILLIATISAYTSKYLIPFLSTKSDLYQQVSSTAIQDGSLFCILMALCALLFNHLMSASRNEPSRISLDYICIFIGTSLSLFCFTGMNIRIAAIITFAAFAAVSFLTAGKESFLKSGQQSKMFDLAKGIVWVPAIISVGLEFIYICAEKGLVIPFPWLVLAIVAAAFIFAQRKVSAGICIGTLTSLCTVAFFNHAYSVTWDFNNFANLYEMGNKTVAMETIRLGSLPIIDYFSAHAVFDVWTQLVHAIANPSVVGVLADPYGGLNDTIALIIIFFILKSFLSPAAALLFVALFPLNVLGIKAYNICFVAVLAHYLLQKNFTTKKSIAFWVIIAFNAFFLYDDGISLGIASIVATSLMLICKRDKKSLFAFFSAGAAVGTSLAFFAWILCITKGIAPADRLKEWLELTLKSSAIWATESFGNAKSIPFVFAYFIAPASASLAFYYTAYKCIRNKQISIIAGTTIIFAVAELLFIPRGIIFHNLTEMNGLAGRLINFWPWTISCFALFLVEERNVQKQAKDWLWVFAFAASLFIVASSVTRYLPNANAQLFSSSIHNAEQFHNAPSQKIQGPRIVYSERTADFILAVKSALDSILTPEETFLDFSNATALYALTERTSPSYVAQSPGLLSTPFTQKQLLQQMEQKGIPIAIVGNADLPYLREMTWEPHNIPHNIRYYLIAEYIYKNYKPFKVIGELALWCKVDRCNEFLPYDYDANLRNAHAYSLNMLPYVWAHYDIQKASSNPKVLNSRQASYLKLQIENKAQKNSAAKITLSSENVPRTIAFNFTVVPGEDTYLIRVSADSYWHAFDFDNIQLSGEDLTLLQSYFIEGE